MLETLRFELESDKMELQTPAEEDGHGPWTAMERALEIGDDDDDDDDDKNAREFRIF